jgi:hypothetical protein
MELQKFINETPAYETIFKEHGLRVKRRRDLLLVTHPYDAPPEGSDVWLRYCRGALIDTTTHRILSVPPIKSQEIQSADRLDDILGEAGSECQPLIEGTMINLCVHQGEWVLSTRSDIGGHNKWRTDPDTSLSFNQMFRECVEPEDLDPTYAYSFVMRHPLNRIVGPVHQRDAYLVEVSETSVDEAGHPQVRRLPPSEYPQCVVENGIHVVDTLDSEWGQELYGNTQVSYAVKGFTVKVGNERYSHVNPAYAHVQSLKPNTDSPYLNYLELRQTGHLKEYLKYFPEKVDLFSEYRRVVHRVTNELYTAYKNVRVYKTQEAKDVPFHLKPLLYALHGLYLSSHSPTSWEDAKQYVHTMPPKQLLFAINHMPVAQGP